jgi:hypothetical protein
LKCQICKDEEAEWAWQPFGPDTSPDSYALLGSHYRGHPVIKVGDVCKTAFQSGDFEVKFEYKGYHFIGKDHQVKEVHISLWDGGACSFDSCRGSGTSVMKDTLDGHELVAIVADAGLVNTFIAAPGLVEACAELDKFHGRIARHLDYVDKAERDAILMALAKVHVQLEQALNTGQ